MSTKSKKVSKLRDSEIYVPPEEAPEEELSVEELRAQLEASKLALFEARAALQSTKKALPELNWKISQKGALSVYGLGRFPVTLYKNQWRRLLPKGDEILEFINENEEGLKD